ncbi:MAG TPA: dipeptidase [Ignavibacteria bacterium]|nr:membrane dipeptidase [Bacteroidota bacterium]HRE10037.1 dipeptidase [Ignavibacteria bacterium]HRF66896.1 dipeptidase [Ignavibacteria bacterium]HRJ04619.1 dipeptidase [Ignavibacteria bacterium]HRJ86457.1 dipeptidase [Ignavibacteria bacterium]
MKILILAIIPALMLCNFACFSGKTDGTSGSQMQSQTDSTKQTDSNKVSNVTGKQDSTMNTNKYTDLNKDAFALHYDAIVIDTHNDILMPVFLQGADLNKDNPGTQSDIIKWKRGGLDIQMFSIYVPERFKSNHFSYVMKLIDKLEENETENPGSFALCRNYAELESGLRAGKFVGLLGGEGGNMIEGSMENLETLYSRGVRYLGLTWNTSNAIAISAKDETERGRAGGLTEFGKGVVKRMNELGMLIDVSHLGETAFWDVVELSNAPIIASHSNCYSLAPHYRNLTDEQIKAIAKSGGYIGINFYYKFLDPSGNQTAIKNAQSKYRNAANKFAGEYGDDLIGFNEKRYEYIINNPVNSGTSVDILIDHIDHIVKLVGVDYVGLGSDFDGSITTVNELYDATCYPIITKKLVERGYTEQDIRKILGGNFLRVFKQVCG